METSRRKVLMSTLFGAGYVGLRALATGIPASVLLQGRRAFADGAPACADSSPTRMRYSASDCCRPWVPRLSS